MVVHGKEDAARGPAGGPQIKGGFAAVASDFQARPQLCGLAGHRKKPPALCRVQEALGLVDQMHQGGI